MNLRETLADRAEKLPFRRVEVTGRSMQPAYRDGDWLLLATWFRPRAGQVVALRDPRQPTKIIVKRIASLTPESIEVRGDNPEFSTDSRHFGSVPRSSLLGRVLLRYGRRHP